MPNIHFIYIYIYLQISRRQHQKEVLSVPVDDIKKEVWVFDFMHSEKRQEFTLAMKKLLKDVV